MFTVKATYRNETRKFSFSGTVLFPTYEELYHQLYRIFPISHSYYLSQLIFSPDASKPSRILIGKEVHTAEEYSTRIAPLRRRWPNPLLRFSIFDETPHKVPSATAEVSRQVPSPLSFMAIPPPPVLMPPSTSLNLSPAPSLDTRIEDILSFKAAYLPTLSYRPLPIPERPSFLMPPLIPPPPPPIILREPPALSGYPSLPSFPSLLPQVASPQPCCSVAKGKSEIETLLASFKKDIDRIMVNTFGECNVSAQVDTSLCQNPVGNEAPHASASTESPSSHWCFACRNEFSGSWYGCVKCPWHFICPSCFSRSGAVHTFSFGPTHVVQQRQVAPLVAVTPSVAEVPTESQSTGTKPVDAEPNQCPPVIHRNIVCDNCNETIVGVRRKCLDCPDYDLCTPCIDSGAAERHNSFHEFFDIETPGRVFVHTVFSGSGERDGSATSRSATADSPRTPVATSASTIETARHSASCNMCDSAIVGDRFKCVNCPDFDTCADCFKITGEQHPNHGFVRVGKTSDLLMRNAMANAVTHYAKCDSCRKTIRGVRYKCMHPSCPDFDLCQNCEALPIPVHPSIHPLLKMKTPDTVVPIVYRVGMTNVIHSRRTSRGSAPQTVEPRPPKSPPVSVSRTSEISVKTEQEPPLVVPESLNPLPSLAQCLDYVSANSVGPWGYGLTPAKLPQSPQSSAPNCSSSPTKLRKLCVSDCYQTVRPVESQQPSAVDREQSASPCSNLVQTVYGPSAVEVNPPPLSLNTSLDIFREVWPTVNREMEHLIEARQSEVDSSSSVADSDKAIETHLGKMVEYTNSLVKAMSPEESVESLLKEVLPAIPSFSIDVPPMIEPLFSADRDLAALLCGFRIPSPVASEAPAPSCTTFSALPDSVSDEQAAATPSPEQQQARLSLSCAFVSDTTVPDGQIFPPGAEFVKSWRMLNDGEKPWPELTELRFVAGEPFAPEADSSMVAKVGRVDPGVALDVWTGDLKAPDAPGRYVGYWKLTDGAGENFGANIWIDVTVTEPRQSADEAEDHSLASSSMVMPKSSSDNRSAPSVGPLGHLFEPSYPSTSKPTTDVTDDGASDGSSVSLVSVPSSDDYGSDWQDTHSQPENLEYVVLYDSNGSEDE